MSIFFDDEELKEKGILDSSKYGYDAASGEYYRKDSLEGMLMALFQEEDQMEEFAKEQFSKGRIEALRNLIEDGLTTFEAIKATDRYTLEELAAICPK